MSKVSSLLKPARVATPSAPATPPAGPDISRLTGLSCAARAEERPPSERRMCSLTPRILEVSSRSRFCTYLATTGRM